MAKLYGSLTCRIEFLHAGFRELLTSPEVHDVVRRAANAIRQDAIGNSGLSDEDFLAETSLATRNTNYQYPGRYLAIVAPCSDAGRRAEATDKVLSIAAVRPRGV